MRQASDAGLINESEAGMYNQLYLDSQRRVIDLVSPLSDAELERRTPACPLWSVHDVLAHLAGSSAVFAGAPSDGVSGDGVSGDGVSGDGVSSVPGDDVSNDGNPAEWTRAQVELRRDRSVAELAAEWQRHLPAIGQLPLSSRSWLPILHDALSHEADIRGAIGAPMLPADALAAAWPLLTEAITRRLAPLGTVLLKLDEQLVPIGDGNPAVEVEATRFDFWRAWFGRRSRAQMSGWVRLGDPDRFADLLPVFPARDTDLIEIG